MDTTRTNDSSQTPNAQHIPATSETLTERRLRWSNLLRSQHYQPVIEDVLNAELPKYTSSSPVGRISHVSHMRECALILSSAPLVYAAAVDGDLVRRMLTDTNLQQEYRAIQQRAYEQPSIYIHLLADEKGVAPTPNQSLVIRDMVLDYIAEGNASVHAWHLDNITRPFVSKSLSNNEYRKYLHTQHRSPVRVATFHRYCAGIQARYNETPSSLHDVPMRFPPGECGYSINSHLRLRQHRLHQSSNYIMNLIEDICTYLHSTNVLTQHFRMHQFIIYLIFRPSQAAIAEIFCSGLLQVWIGNGGGFNGTPAGRSNSSEQRVGADEWEALERWTREGSPVEGNMRVQRERAEMWCKALEWEGGGEGEGEGEDLDDELMGDG